MGAILSIYSCMNGENNIYAEADLIRAIFWQFFGPIFYITAIVAVLMMIGGIVLNIKNGDDDAR